MTPLWLKLISEHQRSGGIALTIPHLIGATRGPQNQDEMSEEAAKTSIVKLLESFLENIPDDLSVRIYECLDLDGQPVATLEKRSDLFSDHMFLDGFDSVLVQNSLANEFSIAGVTSSLFNLLHEPICHARFNYVDHKYVAFTDDVSQLIEITAAAENPLWPTFF